MFARLIDTPAERAYSITLPRPTPGFTRKLFAHARHSRNERGANPVLASILPNFLPAFDAPEPFRRQQHG